MFNKCADSVLGLSMLKFGSCRPALSTHKNAKFCLWNLGLFFFLDDHRFLLTFAMGQLEISEISIEGP